MSLNFATKYFVPSNIWTMIDKRTTSSQNYKQFQHQQQQKLSSRGDVLPPSKFDVSFADPAFGNIYQLLKVTHLYLCATHSPVSSSLLHILQQFEQLAAHTTSTVAKYAVQTIKPTMIEQIPSPLCNPRTAPFLQYRIRLPTVLFVLPKFPKILFLPFLIIIQINSS